MLCSSGVTTRHATTVLGREFANRPSMSIHQDTAGVLVLPALILHAKHLCRPSLPYPAAAIDCELVGNA